MNGDPSSGVEGELRGRREGYQEQGGYWDTGMQRQWEEGGLQIKGELTAL